jgi:hypothetical protein
MRRGDRGRQHHPNLTPMDHVDNEIAAASTEFSLRVAVRDGCRPDAQFTASIGKHDVQNKPPP